MVTPYLSDGAFAVSVSPHPVAYNLMRIILMYLLVAKRDAILPRKSRTQ